MKYLIKLRNSILILSVLILAVGQTAFAADEEPEYTYTVRLFAGNPEIGRLTGGGVRVSGSGASIQYEKDQVVITGLGYKDVLYINPNEAAEILDNRYYLKGVRTAGRDLEEEAVASPDSVKGTFTVTGDRDIVIGYGVSGDMVAYTVNYVDASGNALLDSDTYYGNAGERQYVSARYVEGYAPQAYNLVKTLSSNEAENVFDFRYTPETTAVTNTGTETATSGTSGAAGAAAETEEADNTPAAPGEEEEAAATPEDEEGVPEEEDNAPQELVDLDDEQTPLANQSLDNERPGTMMSYLPIYIGIGMAAVAVLILSALYLRKHRKTVATPETLLEEIHEEFRDDE